MVDYTGLIGTPYVKGGRDLSGLDCYGLIIELEARENKVIPDYHSPDDKAAIALLMDREKVKWTEHWRRKQGETLDTRIVQPGQVLLFEIQGVPFHVGMSIGSGRFIHTWEKSGGVLIERLSLWKHRVCGIYSFAGEVA